MERLPIRMLERDSVANENTDVENLNECLFYGEKEYERVISYRICIYVYYHGERMHWWKD